MEEAFIVSASQAGPRTTGPRSAVPAAPLEQVRFGAHPRSPGKPQTTSALAAVVVVFSGRSLVSRSLRRRSRRRGITRRATAVQDAPVQQRTVQGSASQGGQNAKTALIVGGGVGGLATAAQLAKNGVKVTLLEKNPEVGGRCQSVASSTVPGYRWDTGPSLLLLPEKYADAFKRMGSDIEKELNLKRVEPAYRVAFADNTHIDVDYDPMKMTEQMEKFEPGCTSNYYRFLSVARRMLDMGMERFVDRQFESWAELVDPLGLLPEMYTKGWFTIPLINMLLPIDSLMNAWFQDERLRALFTFQTLYVGLTPYNSPGALCLLAGTDLTDGVWYPMGGWQGITDSLLKLAKDNGAELRTGVKVDEVLVENGRAVGVRLEGGETKTADVVVVNEDLPGAYRKLLRNADQAIPASKKEGSSTPIADASQEWQGREYSCGVIAFYWAVDCNVDYLQHHNVFLGSPIEQEKSWKPITSADEVAQHPNFYVHCPKRTDPSAAPKVGESIMVLFPVGNFQDFEKKGRTPDAAAYEEIRKAARAAILRRFKEIGCGDLTDHIVEETVRTPVQAKELYALEKGATFGMSHGLLPSQGGLAMTRPAPRCEELDGLFFVGASTRPGNGVPLVLMGAGLTSELILDTLAKEASGGRGAQKAQSQG
mmetsp:Transcript_21640/g.50570  ORF Transcript_21640/g.50570 Transcript_21640/m.50570 type:complete len:652 (+) Transcript_21640:82-2037(+)